MGLLIICVAGTAEAPAQSSTLLGALGDAPSLLPPDSLMDYGPSSVSRSNQTCRMTAGRQPPGKPSSQPVRDVYCATRANSLIIPCFKEMLLVLLSQLFKDGGREAEFSYNPVSNLPRKEHVSV